MLGCCRVSKAGSLDLKRVGLPGPLQLGRWQSCVPPLSYTLPLLGLALPKPWHSTELKQYVTVLEHLHVCHPDALTRSSPRSTWQRLVGAVALRLKCGEVPCADAKCQISARLLTYLRQAFTPRKPP